MAVSFFNKNCAPHLLACLPVSLFSNSDYNHPLLTLPHLPFLDASGPYCQSICTDPFYNLHITDRFVVYAHPADNRLIKFSLHHIAVVQDSNPSSAEDAEDARKPTIFHHPKKPIFIAEDVNSTQKGAWGLHLDIAGHTLALRRAYPKLRKSDSGQSYTKNIFLRYSPHIDMTSTADYRPT